MYDELDSPDPTDGPEEEPSTALEGVYGIPGEEGEADYPPGDEFDDGFGDAGYGDPYREDDYTASGWGDQEEAGWTNEGWDDDGATPGSDPEQGWGNSGDTQDAYAQDDNAFDPFDSPDPFDAFLADDSQGAAAEPGEASDDFPGNDPGSEAFDEQSPWGGPEDDQEAFYLTQATDESRQDNGFEDEQAPWEGPEGIAEVAEFTQAPDGDAEESPVQDDQQTGSEEPLPLPVLDGGGETAPVSPETGDEAPIEAPAEAPVETAVVGTGTGGAAPTTQAPVRTGLYALRPTHPSGADIAFGYAETRQQLQPDGYGTVEAEAAAFSLRGGRESSFSMFRATAALEHNRGSQGVGVNLSAAMASGNTGQQDTHLLEAGWGLLGYAPGSYGPQSSYLGLRGDVLSFQADAHVGPGRASFGVQGTIAGAEARVGIPGGALNFEGALNAGLGARLEGRFGEDTDGDGRGEYGARIDIGPFAAGFRVEPATVVEHATAAVDWAGRQATGAADWAGRQATGVGDWTGRQATGAANWADRQATGLSDWTSRQAAGVSDWVGRRLGRRQ